MWPNCPLEKLGCMKWSLDHLGLFTVSSLTLGGGVAEEGRGQVPAQPEVTQ